MSLQLHRPGPEGRLEPASADQPTAAVQPDYRRRLRSRRWGAAELSNPDMHVANPWLAVGLIVLLAAATFVILVLGYWSHVFG